MSPDLWTNMFLLKLSILEKLLRPAIVYLFLVVALRVAGKRELAQLNPFDLVVLISLSNTVQNAMIGDDNSVVGGLIGAASLIAINFLVVRFLYEHPKLDELAEGRADVLIEKGKIRQDRLKKELITISELEAAAHRQGFRSLHEVETAVLEPGGTVTMMAKQPTPETSRHRELLQRLDQITRTLNELQSGQHPA